MIEGLLQAGIFGSMAQQSRQVNIKMPIDTGCRAANRVRTLLWVNMQAPCKLTVIAA
jgi:hypothetical protein